MPKPRQDTHDLAASATIPDDGFMKSGRSMAIDILLASLIAVGFAAIALMLSARLDYRLLCANYDVWFDSDAVRVVDTMGDRYGNMHGRSNFHPLWPLAVDGPLYVVAKLLGLKMAVKVLVATQAGVFGGTLYAVVRAMGAARVDAVLSAALFLSTAASWFWLPIPETFVLGAASMLVSVLWLALPRGTHDQWSAPLQSIVSLSITISNWFAGLLAALIGLGWRRAFVVSSIAFSIVGALTFVQYRLFPKAGALFNIWRDNDMSHGARGDFLQHAQTFFVHSLAAGHPQLHVTNTLIEAGIMSRMQFATFEPSAATIGYLLAWAVLAAAGVFAAVRGHVSRQVALLVGGVLVFCFCLHAVYGLETFLYSMHFAPFFVLVASWALLLGKPIRNVMRGLVLVAVMTGALHNGAVFADMSAWFNRIDPATVAGSDTALCRRVGSAGVAIGP
jgi:hypothetical protein